MPEVSLNQPPSPDLLFYYVLTILLGFAFISLLIWIVNRFVSHTQKSIDILTNSVIKLEAKLMLQENDQKNVKEEVKVIKEEHNKILTSFDSTLQKIDTTWRMLMMDRAEGKGRKG